MAQELLAVKLGEMDQKIGRLHGRIESSEYADAKMLQEEIENLRRECRENQEYLIQRMKYSRAKPIQKLFHSYTEIENVVDRIRGEIRDVECTSGNQIFQAEELTVFAEYALDFAMQAADYAALLSMDAMKAQKMLEEEEK